MRTKKIDIPQTPKAEKLLVKLSVLNTELEAVNAANKKEMDKLQKKQEALRLKTSKKIWTAATALQEVCAHNELEIIDDFDYHKREEWTITNCVICKKRISRV